VRRSSDSALGFPVRTYPTAREQNLHRGGVSKIPVALGHNSAPRHCDGRFSCSCDQMKHLRYSPYASSFGMSTFFVASTLDARRTNTHRIGRACRLLHHLTTGLAGNTSSKPRFHSVRTLGTDEVCISTTARAFGC